MIIHDHFYGNIVLTNTNWTTSPTFKFGFTVGDGAILIFNDSRTRTIQYSFNGRVLHGEVLPKDKWHTLDRKKESRIWLRVSPSASAEVRLEAYL